MHRLFIRFFWDTYDFLGRLLLLNAIALVLCLPILTIPGVIAGLLYFMHLVSSNREPTIRDFFQAFRAFYLRALLMVFLYITVGIIIIYNIRFYLSPSVVPESLRFPAALLAGVFFWLIVILAASCFYTFPALVKFDMKPMAALKRGFIYLLANPGLSIYCLILAFVVIFLSIVSGVGIVIFLLVLPAAVANATYDAATERLERLIEEQEEEKGKSAESRPSSWYEIKAMEKKREEKETKRDRYSRTLKDVLRPWDYK